MQVSCCGWKGWDMTWWLLEGRWIGHKYSWIHEHIILFSLLLVCLTFSIIKKKKGKLCWRQLKENKTNYWISIRKGKVTLNCDWLALFFKWHLQSLYCSYLQIVHTVQSTSESSGRWTHHISVGQSVLRMLVAWGPLSSSGRSLGNLSSLAIQM